MATTYWEETDRDLADDPEQLENQIRLKVPLLHPEKKHTTDVKMGFSLRTSSSGQERHLCNWKRIGSITSPACSNFAQARESSYSDHPQVEKALAAAGFTNIVSEKAYCGMSLLVST